jgi:PAS domain S-box-containing protein
MFVKPVEFFPASVLNYDFFMSTFGFPIQICRAVCAVVLAVSMVNLLSIFRWETRETLRRSEHRCSTIASATPIILFVQDVNSVITFIQGKGLELIGLETDKVVGKPVNEVFPSAPQFGQDSLRALAGEEFSSTVVLGDVVFECCYSSLRDKDGEITGVIGVALDVTVKVRAQKQLDNYRKQVQKNTRLAEIGSMGSIMAKELDEPLAVARLLLERIATERIGGDSGVSIDESLKKSVAEISKASEILSRFCSASQIGGDVAIPVDIYQLAKRVMTAFAQSAKHVNLSIALKDMTCVACLPISSHELEQLFFILIQNAIDAANSSLRQHLTISCKCSEQSIELHFSDTCGGIAAERLEHIFEPFFSDETRTGRTGIGLAMAKQIVTSHGGDMRVESEKGKGSTFVVSLPVERVY